MRDGEALLVTGGTASARMGELAGQVARALREGVAPRDALVACADPSVAVRMRRALRATEAPGAGEVPVMTCRELACKVVAHPRAAEVTGVRFTGGRARLLGAYETDFVLEDLKTLGSRPRRLRELLKFLYRGWTELSDEDPEWLFMVEEIETFSFLTDELRYLGAVMEPQVGNLATKALRLDDGLRDRFARRRLFVLDYQNLSRASQLLCQLVAGEGLAVAALAEASAQTHDSYPYPQGVGELGRLNPALATEDLGPADDGGVARSGRAWETPSDEAEGVADEVASLAATGRDMSDVAVMTFHPWWTRRAARALAARGVAVNAWEGPMRIRGDIRDLGRCLAPRMVALLRLLADGHDATAWRSWLGFGDYLTRSNLFVAMRTAGDDADGPSSPARDAAAEIARLCREALAADGGRGVGAYAPADPLPLLERMRGLRGSALLEGLAIALAGDGATVPAALAPLLSLGPEADAARMVAELDRLQFSSGIPDRPGVVVAPYEAMAGLDFGQVFVVGLVDGLFPNAAYFDLTKVSVSKQRRMHERDCARARAISRLARGGMHVSWFERADHEFAERVGLRQTRIYAVDDEGAQMSEVRKSMYADVLLARA